MVETKNNCAGDEREQFTDMVRYMHRYLSIFLYHNFPLPVGDSLLLLNNKLL
jgi:hypothetical protein